MNRLLAIFFEGFIQHGQLEVITSSGISHMFGNGKGQSVAIRFQDRAAQIQLLLNPALALGELFMDGRLVIVRGTIYDLLLIATRNLASQSRTRSQKLWSRLRKTFRPLQQLNSERRAKRNVAHHYDLDAQLYDMLLDTDKQYSCAYFEHADQSLEDAQLAKKRHIAAKLLIEPGHRVLDIGSGWGGLALYLADHCDANVTGVTLSNEQLQIARHRTIEEDLVHTVDFKLQDYRTVQGQFDRIVSVGMFEHVGVGYYDTFFSKVADLLADDGVMLLHFIGGYGGPGVTNPWMAKYIFPGGYAPALSEVLPAIERAGLIVTDVEILRLHYAETLKAWRERFMAQRDKAKEIYDERFCRMWEFYLAGCEVGFRRGDLVVFQIQLAKQHDVVPVTRNYIEEREVNLRTRERQVPHWRTAAE